MISGINYEYLNYRCSMCEIEAEIKNNLPRSLSPGQEEPNFKIEGKLGIKISKF